jgi:hypothetical protein
MHHELHDVLESGIEALPYLTTEFCVFSSRFSLLGSWDQRRGPRKMRLRLVDCIA